MKTQSKLLQDIYKQISLKDYCEVSFSLFNKVFNINNEDQINPVATKLSRKAGFQFNINWSFNLITFRKRGRKVGLA